MLILVGGAFILSPGFVLDAVGLLCILPLTRPIGRRILSGLISRKLVGVSFTTGPAGGQRGPGGVPTGYAPAGPTAHRGRVTTWWSRARSSTITPTRPAELAGRSRDVQGRISARRLPSSCGHSPGAGARGRSRRRAAARDAR